MERGACKGRRGLLSGQDGAAAVEFAIILPLLIVLIFGMIEFSILFYNKAMITNASREGARAGIVFDFDVPDGEAQRVPDSEITSKVNSYCAESLITFGDGGKTPAVAVARTGNAAGDSLTVTVTYHYDYLVLPNFISELAGGVDLSAVTVMRLE